MPDLMTYWPGAFAGFSGTSHAAHQTESVQELPFRLTTKGKKKMRREGGGRRRLRTKGTQPGPKKKRKGQWLYWLQHVGQDGKNPISLSKTPVTGWQDRRFDLFFFRRKQIKPKNSMGIQCLRLCNRYTGKPSHPATHNIICNWTLCLEEHRKSFETCWTKQCLEEHSKSFETCWTKQSLFF